MKVKLYLSNEIEDHKPLTLYAISPPWTKRLEESYFTYYPLDDYNCISNLNILQKCVIGAYTRRVDSIIQ